MSLEDCDWREERRRERDQRRERQLRAEEEAREAQEADRDAYLDANKTVRNDA